MTQELPLCGRSRGQFPTRIRLVDDETPSGPALAAQRVVSLPFTFPSRIDSRCAVATNGAHIAPALNNQFDARKSSASHNGRMKSRLASGIWLIGACVGNKLHSGQRRVVARPMDLFRGMRRPCLPAKVRDRVPWLPALTTGRLLLLLSLLASSPNK